MGMYKVLISRTAEKQLKRIAKPYQKRLVAVILSFEIEPRPFGYKKLSGTDSTYRVRVGDFRVIYEIHDKEVLVTVLKIGHRSEIYR